MQQLSMFIKISRNAFGQHSAYFSIQTRPLIQPGIDQYIDFLICQTMQTHSPLAYFAQQNNQNAPFPPNNTRTTNPPTSTTNNFPYNQAKPAQTSLSNKFAATINQVNNNPVFPAVQPNASQNTIFTQQHNANIFMQNAPSSSPITAFSNSQPTNNCQNPLQSKSQGQPTVYNSLAKPNLPFWHELKPQRSKLDKTIPWTKEEKKYIQYSLTCLSFRMQYRKAQLSNIQIRMFTYLEKSGQLYSAFNSGYAIEAQKDMVTLPENTFFRSTRDNSLHANSNANLPFAGNSGGSVIFGGNSNNTGSYGNMQGSSVPFGGSSTAKGPFGKPTSSQGGNIFQNQTQNQNQSKGFFNQNQPNTNIFQSSQGNGPFSSFTNKNQTNTSPLPQQPFFGNNNNNPQNQNNNAFGGGIFNNIQNSSKQNPMNNIFNQHQPFQQQQQQQPFVLPYDPKVIEAMNGSLIEQLSKNLTQEQLSPLMRQFLHSLGITDELLAFLLKMGLSHEEIKNFIISRSFLKQIEREKANKLSLLSSYYNRQPFQHGYPSYKQPNTFPHHARYPNHNDKFSKYADFILSKSRYSLEEQMFHEEMKEYFKNTICNNQETSWKVKQLLDELEETDRQKAIHEEFGKREKEARTMRNKMRKSTCEGYNPEYESIWDEKLAELKNENYLPSGEPINPMRPRSSTIFPL